MKSCFIAIASLLFSPLLRGNAGPNTGPPSEQQPSTANQRPAPNPCPCNQAYFPDPFRPPIPFPGGHLVDPVVLSVGKLYYPKVDVIIPGLGRTYALNLHFFRSYNSRDNRVGALGAGWFTTLDITLDNAGGAVPIFNHETGRQMYFTQSSSITFADGHTGAGWHDGGYTLEAVTGGDYELVEKRGVKYRFSSVGQLKYMEDPLGHRLTYNRNGLGQVTTITDSSSQTLSFTYNSGGFLTSVTDPLGRVWGYGYHVSGVWGAGMLAGVAGPAPLNLTERYYYAADGNMVSIKNPRNYITGYAYDSGMDRVTKMTHPDTTDVDFTYNNFNGNSSMEDEDGNTWLYEYAGPGLVTNVIAPDNGVHHYIYNSANELTEYRGPLYNATTAPNRKVVYTWNSAHNLTAITDETGADKTFAYTTNSHELTSETDDKTTPRY